jgi:conjugation system TraG family ATPase
MRTRIFDLPYLGYSTFAGHDMLYTAEGDFSVIIQVKNPVIALSADERGYQEYHELLLKLVKMLGENHILQKQDIFITKSYQASGDKEYLQHAYESHFNGRKFIELRSYFCITRKVDRSRFYVFEERSLQNFSTTVTKVLDLLNQAGLWPELLTQTGIDRYLRQYLSMDFSGELVAKNNIMAGEHQLEIGEKSLRCLSLIDSDAMDLPTSIGAYRQKSDGKAMQDFPLDNLAFLLEVPATECLIYNQVISIPVQRSVISSLTLKQKRHAGIPDPANKLCEQDIAMLLAEVARDNQLLVNAHYNIMLCSKGQDLMQAVNFVESSLFSLGIIPSRNAYNQLELFKSSLPANAGAMKNYDFVLLSAKAAVCLIFKERPAQSEHSEFLIRFTDRKGIPISIDPADLPMRTGRISNRSKFVLGGSGSGKSFFMNSLIEQYLHYNMDIVIIDTGHSYSGLCAYYKGKYLTYSEQQPITMNPFAFSESEYNIEKRDFLKTLIFLVLKGVNSQVSALEDSIISSVISSFYTKHFRENNRKQDLNFDAFYFYSIQRIREICDNDHLEFDLDTYRFVLKKFCQGEEYGLLLNLATDSSLLEERLIVFEIDAIRDHKILFPIVTLIIMDVFLQKMRLRNHQRKALICEEAWKAIASDLMASYLVYVYKTVRKFYGEAVVVTQELDDIISSPTVKNSIIANSDTICLLDQNKFRDDYAKVASLLSLNETEQKKIFTINALENKQGRSRFKEVYIKRGLTGEVYGVEVSLHQYLLFSTEKPEKSAVEYYLDCYGDYQKALDAFIADLQSSGLPLNEFINQLPKPQS